MYVYSDGQSREPHEDYDNTIYWCLKTMKEFGPDDEMVAGPDCRNPRAVLLRAVLTGRQASLARSGHHPSTPECPAFPGFSFQPCSAHVLGPSLTLPAYSTPGPRAHVPHVSLWSLIIDTPAGHDHSRVETGSADTTGRSAMMPDHLNRIGIATGPHRRRSRLGRAGDLILGLRVARALTTQIAPTKGTTVRVQNSDFSV